MNMLARISTPKTIERADPPKRIRLLAASAAELALVESRNSAPPSLEADAHILLDRDERLAILLSLRGSRLGALAGSWLSAIDRILPAASREAVAARAEAARTAALRRFAILYRLDRGGLEFEEDDRLAAAGFSEAQAEVVRRLVEKFEQGWSPPTPAWPRVAALAALAVGGFLLLYRWFESGLGDSSAALILAIVISTGIASFLSVTAHPNGPDRRRPIPRPRRSN